MCSRVYGMNGTENKGGKHKVKPRTAHSEITYCRINEQYIQANINVDRHKHTHSCI